MFYVYVKLFSLQSLSYMLQVSDVAIRINYHSYSVCISKLFYMHESAMHKEERPLHYALVIDYSMPPALVIGAFTPPAHASYIFI